jgi:hypothetical protein
MWKVKFPSLQLFNMTSPLIVYPKLLNYPVKLISHFRAALYSLLSILEDFSDQPCLLLTGNVLVTFNSDDVNICRMDCYTVVKRNKCTILNGTNY